MVLKQVKSVALMSIQPKYANLIAQGHKQVEFRKTRFTREISHILLYSTAPEMKVIGIIETDGCVLAPPLSLWERFSSIGGITKEEFIKYYKILS